MASVNGCPWITERRRSWDAKKKGYAFVPIHCNKLPAADSPFCPKHRLYAETQEQSGANIERQYSRTVEAK